jgi:hypothetical protein
VNGFKPAILDTLTAIVTKKPAFATLPLNVNSIVLKDLKDLQTATSAFEASLIALAPVSFPQLHSRTDTIFMRCPQADLKSQAQTISSQIDAAFVTAVAAYS